ncbi:MAG: Gfo/Idh/MocA family oxidoreductase, partial [Terriglobus sp.]
KKYGADAIYSYADFDRIAGNPAVGAVYIALPVSMHREYTERAAAAGKHVLCEKPMAPNSADAEAMIAACGAARVRLGIAYRCPHTTTHKHLRQLVQTGAFGPLSSLRIESGFGFELKPGWRDEGKLAGGGSMWDVGIYPLNAARFLLGEEPIAVEEASATCDAHGMEREVRWTSVFPSGARATCSSSYMREIADTLRVSGELGSAVMDPAYRWQKPYILHASVHDQLFRGEKTIRDKQGHHGPLAEFRLEAEELAAAVREGRDTICPGEDGLADLRVMEAVYRAAKVPGF